MRLVLRTEIPEPLVLPGLWRVSRYFAGRADSRSATCTATAAS
jgi:hypothetical protein